MTNKCLRNNLLLTIAITITILISLSLNFTVAADEILLKTVSIRVEGIETTIISTPDTYTTSAITAWDALKELLDFENIPYDAPESVYGIYINSINNEEAGRFGGYDGWMFAVNGRMSDYGVDSYEIKEGDNLLFYYGGFGIETIIPKVSLESQRIIAGKEFEIKLEYTYYDYMEDEDKTINVSGAIITINNKEYISDEDGKVKLDALLPGNYILTIDKMGEDGFPELVRDELEIEVYEPVSYLGNIDEEIYETIGYYRQNIKVIEDWDTDWWNIISLFGVKEDINNLGYQLAKWTKDDMPQNPQILDYVKYIFAGKALGYNPYNLEDENLIQSLIEKQDIEGSFGNIINHHIWAMITLDSFNENYNIDKAIDRLLEGQNPDGGFTISEYLQSDLDITAMAIIALTRHNENEDVNDSITKAINFLKSKQAVSGGFIGANGENCNTISLAISSLIICGEDIFSEFWKSEEGYTPLDALLSYRIDSKGFYHPPNTTKVNLMATSQALMALGDIKYGVSIFDRINDLEFINLPFLPEDIGQGDKDDGSNSSTPGNTSKEKYVYLKVTGDPKTGTIYGRKKVNINNGDTPYTVLKKEISDVVVVGKGENVYVKSIKGLSEFDKGPLSGWKYTVNNKDIQVGAAGYILEKGDEVHWFYSMEEEKGGTGRAGKINNVSNNDINSEAPLELEALEKKIQDGIEILLEMDEVDNWSLFVLAQDNQILPYHREMFIQLIKDEKGEFSKITDLSLAVINASILGLNPEDIGGYNLIEQIYKHENLKMQGINGPIFSLLALNTGEYASLDKTNNTIESIIQTIIEEQNDDGGFSLIKGNESSVDITSFALTALVPYKENKGINTVIEKAYKWLSDFQKEKGGYLSYEGIENSESLSWAIIAKTSLAIDCLNDVQELYTYINKDGSFSHIKGGEADLIASQQGLMALLAYKSYINNNEGIFKVKKEKFKEDNFKDIEDVSDWALEYINRGCEYGIIKGDINGEIRPKDNITRAEFTAMIVRLKGLEGKDYEKDLFQDVKKDAWYYQDIMIALDEGIIQGKSPYLFEPETTITREEIAVILSRIMPKEELSNPLPKDIDEVSTWAKDGVKQIYTLGIMSGDGINFNPHMYANREMAIKTIIIYYEREI